MARAGTLTVKLLGDSGPLEKSLGGAGSKIAKFASAAAAAGAVAAVAFGVKAVRAASDLNETLSKTQEVFGDATGKVTGFADKMADAFGLPKQEILDAASNIGLVAQASGLAEDAAADMSVEMAQLAADASSFYNVPLDVALEKIRAGLVGEAEPLRSFGVLLSAAAVEEKALAMGIAEVGEELTEQQKVMARSAIISEQMAAASGDLEKTQDSLANRVKALQGRFANLTAEVGQKLLPIVLSAWDQLEAWWAENGPVITAWFQELGRRAVELGQTVSDWWTNDVKPVFDAFVAAVQENWPKVQQLFETLGEIVGDVGSIFKTELDNMSGDVGDGTESMNSDVGTLLDTLNVLASTAAAVSGAVSKTWNLLTGAVTGDLGKMTKGIDQFTGGALSSMQSWASGVHATVRENFGAMAAAVREKINLAIGFINGLINRWNSIDLSITLPSVPDWVPGIGGNGGQTLRASTPNMRNLPTLHTGGVFRAPAGQGEGLALLRDREIVTTPEAAAQPFDRETARMFAREIGRELALQMRSA